MGNPSLSHSRYVCLLRLGKSSDEAKALLGLQQKEIGAYSGVPVSNPELTLDISKSSTVRSGKYAVYLHSDKEVILLNSANFYFVSEPLDGIIEVAK